MAYSPEQYDRLRRKGLSHQQVMKRLMRDPEYRKARKRVLEQKARDAAKEQRTASAPTSSQSYTVSSGESWASIAGKIYGDQSLYQQIIKANPDTNMLRPGMTITIPGVSGQAETPTSAAPSPPGERTPSSQSQDEGTLPRETPAGRPIRGGETLPRETPAGRPLRTPQPPQDVGAGAALPPGAPGARTEEYGPVGAPGTRTPAYEESSPTYPQEDLTAEEILAGERQPRPSFREIFGTGGVSPSTLRGELSEETIQEAGALYPWESVREFFRGGGLSPSEKRALLYSGEADVATGKFPKGISPFEKRGLLYSGAGQIGADFPTTPGEVKTMTQETKEQETKEEWWMGPPEDYRPAKSAAYETYAEDPTLYMEHLEALPLGDMPAYILGWTKDEAGDWQRVPPGQELNELLEAHGIDMENPDPDEIYEFLMNNPKYADLAERLGYFEPGDFPGLRGVGGDGGEGQPYTYSLPSYSGGRQDGGRPPTLGLVNWRI